MTTKSQHVSHGLEKVGSVALRPSMGEPILHHRLDSDPALSQRLHDVFLYRRLPETTPHALGWLEEV